MKRFLGFSILCAVALATVCSLATPARASHPVTVQLLWTEATSDTCFITDEADTQRTAAFDLSNVSFPEGNASSAAALEWGRVTFVAQVSNGVSDTLRYTMEYSNTAAGKPEVWSYLPGSGVNGATDAVGNVALIKTAGGAGANGVYAGSLLEDPDSGVPSETNAHGAQRIRLRVIGDQSGTTPKLSGVRCYLTYQAKD